MPQGVADPPAMDEPGDRDDQRHDTGGQPGQGERVRYQLHTVGQASGTVNACRPSVERHRRQQRRHGEKGDGARDHATRATATGPRRFAVGEHERHRQHEHQPAERARRGTQGGQPGGSSAGAVLEGSAQPQRQKAFSYSPGSRSERQELSDTIAGSRNDDEHCDRCPGSDRDRDGELVNRNLVVGRKAGDDHCHNCPRYPQHRAERSGE